VTRSIAIFVAFALAALVSDATTQPLNRNRVVITGTVWEADGLTAVQGVGGKDWWIECVPDAGNQAAIKVTYAGAAYRVEIDQLLLRTPVVQLGLYDGPNKFDCVMERLVVSREPTRIDWAFMPKQGK
jgi:hypothetical protein